MRGGDLILGGSVFQKKVTGSRPRCAAKCLKNTVCISFNYHSSTGDCQLNNATILNDCSNVQPLVGYKHYETVSTFNGPPYETFWECVDILSNSQLYATVCMNG